MKLNTKLQEKVTPTHHPVCWFTAVPTADKDYKVCKVSCVAALPATAPQSLRNLSIWTDILTTMHAGL